MTVENLEIGILVDDGAVREWERRVIETLANRDEVSITLVLTNSMSQSTIGAAADKLLSDGVWGAAVGLRDLLIDPWFRQSVSLEDIECLSGTKRMSCEPLDSEGLGWELPAEAVDALESRCDLAFRFGFGILCGAALTAPEYGVMSFHHGDLTEYRGRPAGFWEYYHGEQTAGVTLQRLSESLDGGEIVASASVDISDCRSWTGVQDRLFNCSESVAREGITTIVSGADSQQPPGLGEVYTAPDSKHVVFLAGKRVRELLKQHRY